MCRIPSVADPAPNGNLPSCPPRPCYHVATAVAENQPVNKHRMKYQPLSAFAAKLRRSILSGFDPAAFDDLAVELFTLQYEHNAAYRPLCNLRRITPSQLILARTMTPTEPRRWAQVPFVHTAVFK